jgi:hypothetical protein
MTQFAESLVGCNHIFWHEENVLGCNYIVNYSGEIGDVH